MEMPIPGHQEEPAKSARVPPEKEGLFKGPASSEPKVAGTVLRQLSEAERLGISDHILSKFLLLSKQNPMLPAGLTNSMFLLPTASVIHTLAGQLLCFSSPPPPHFNTGGGHLSCPRGACYTLRPADLCRQLPSAGEQPQANKKFSNKKRRKQWLWFCPQH